MKKENDCYDVEEVKKELRRLKIPSEYMQIDLEAINAHDINLIMSIRKDSGKTTATILIGLVLNFLYSYEIEYNRIDESQTTGSKIRSLFDVIEKFDYISKIYRGKYNAVEYKSRDKVFYLILKNEEGEIIQRSQRPILIIHSLENWQDYKSSYNNVNGNWFIVDEFFDTKRSTNYQIIELFNNISTITRERPEARCVMLGNNLNKFSFWFQEFGIDEEINTLNFGGIIDKTTNYGTTIYATLLDISPSRKQNLLKRKIRFFGLDSPKVAAFNGLQAFAGNSWQHMDDAEKLNPDLLIYNRIFIRHRNRYIQIRLYCNNSAYYCYLNFSNKPRYNDNIILSSAPEAGNKQEIYGFGEYCQIEKVKNKLRFIKNLRIQDQWFYSTNAVGDLVYDYLKEIR